MGSFKTKALPCLLFFLFQNLYYHMIIIQILEWLFKFYLNLHHFSNQIYHRRSDWTNCFLQIQISILNHIIQSFIGFPDASFDKTPSWQTIVLVWGPCVKFEGPSSENWSRKPKNSKQSMNNLGFVFWY